MACFIKKLIKDESGATAIEYGLIVAGLAVGISASLTSVQTQLISTFSSLTSTMSSVGQ